MSTNNSKYSSKNNADIYEEKYSEFMDYIKQNSNIFIYF